RVTIADVIDQDRTLRTGEWPRDISPGCEQPPEGLELMRDPVGELLLAPPPGLVPDRPLQPPIGSAAPDHPPPLVDSIVLEAANLARPVHLGSQQLHSGRRMALAAVDRGLFATLHHVQDIGDQLVLEERLRYRLMSGFDQMGLLSSPS